jgi:hypothetical protein
VSQQKNLPLEKNQHSDKNEEEIRCHQLSSLAAISLCPVI